MRTCTRGRPRGRPEEGVGRMVSRRQLIVLASALLAILAGPPLTPATSQGRPVVVMQGVEPLGLDASITTGIFSLNPALHILEPLVDFDEKLRIIPRLATAWKWVNPTTFELTLRPGVKFHDGTPFGAVDVKFTFDRILDAKNRSDFRRYFSERTVKEVQATGERTVRFVLTEPRPVFLRTLTQVGITPQKAVTEMGAERFNRAPVGTGPYRIREWASGVRITMTANRDYWGGNPRIPELVWRWVSEDATRVAELLSGNADIITGLPPDLVKQVDENATARVASVRSLRTAFILINTKKPPFNDVRVRKALNHAVNVQSIIDNLMGGFAERVPTVMGPFVAGYNPRLKPFAYDPETARKLLAEAGHPSGFTANFFAFRGRLLKDRELSEAVTAHLQRIGINLRLQFLDFAVVFGMTQRYNRDVDLMLWSNANNNADASYNLELNFYSKGRGTYWSDPKVDELIESAATEVDETRRERTYQEILRLITEVHVPVVFLYDQKDLYGVSRRLEWEPRADERINLWRAFAR